MHDPTLLTQRAKECGIEVETIQVCGHATGTQGGHRVARGDCIDTHTKSNEVEKITTWERFGRPHWPWQSHPAALERGNGGVSFETGRQKSDPPSGDRQGVGLYRAVQQVFEWGDYINTRTLPHRSRLLSKHLKYTNLPAHYASHVIFRGSLKFTGSLNHSRSSTAHCVPIRPSLHPTPFPYFTHLHSPPGVHRRVQVRSSPARRRRSGLGASSDALPSRWEHPQDEHVPARPEEAGAVDPPSRWGGASSACGGGAWMVGAPAGGRSVGCRTGRGWSWY